MSIEVEKPEPMRLGDKLYYTLSSYDPVMIEVEIPRVMDEDVNLLLDSIIDREGGEPGQVDETWLMEHFDGLSTLDAVRSRLRTQIEQVNAAYAEDSKPALAVAELAKRLKQKVPEQQVAIYREIFAQQFDADLARDGMTRDDFLARAGGTPDGLERMFQSRALEMAEQVAALDAFVDEKKLTVEDDEIEGLLGVPPEQAADIVRQAQADNAMDELRTVALRNKATRVLVAECSCVYKHETPEEAEARVAAFRRMTEVADKLDDEDEDKAE